MGYGKKSQFAIEFSLMLSLAMIMILALAGIIYYFTTQYSENKNIKQVTDLGYSLQSELILASEVQDGYQRTIVIPDKINDVLYTMTMTGSDLILNYKGSDFLFPIPNVTGSFEKGADYYNMIRKNNDEVTIESGLR